MKNTKLKKIGFLFLGALLATGFFVATATVLAQTTANLGVDAAAATGLSAVDIRVTIARIIHYFLGFLGIVTVVVILYAGFEYMRSGGEEERIKRAKSILVNAVIGLVIILSSYAITSFIIKSLLAATKTAVIPLHCSNGVLDNDETNIDCGGECGVCGGGSFADTGADAYTQNVFTVKSVPATGDMCVRNVQVAVSFSKNVDLKTLNANLLVVRKTDGGTVLGVWQYNGKNTTAVFVPQGSCAPEAGNDCLAPKTNYTLLFKNPTQIKSQDGLTLQCSGKPGCAAVDFVSGESVNRTAPVISLVSPSNGASIIPSPFTPVQIAFQDTSGIQNISLFEGDTIIGSQNFPGCQKTGSLNLNWPTLNIKPGTYVLDAIGINAAGQKGESTVQVKVRPGHCFNNALEADLGEVEKGPVACGGECGSCASAVCKDNSECSSGFCEGVANGVPGKCQSKLVIQSLTPKSGAPGSYVTVNGFYFGQGKGKVFFARVERPDPLKTGDWVEAVYPACAGNINLWSAEQLVVQVPSGAVNGPMLVWDNAQKNSDATNDAWGPKITDFEITNQIRPSICGINPNSGVYGTGVQVFGKDFGLLDSEKKSVWFNTIKAEVSLNNWTDTFINTTVPFVGTGRALVKLLGPTGDSNSIYFDINQGQDETLPLISAVTPSTGGVGEYIHITGKNFGNQMGAVWFKASSESQAIIGDFSFPADCAGSLWKDGEIIVKFPKQQGQIGTKYFIQVKTAANKISSLDKNSTFLLNNNPPQPGICKISPISSPVPFPAGKTITLSGEYFGNNPSIYLWQNGASDSSLQGRLVVAKNNIVSNSPTLLTFTPPAGVITGPVVVQTNNIVSNAVNFAVSDCLKNNNSCAGGYQCCAVGRDQGACKPLGEKCEGVKNNSGYVWRFVTKDLPVIPHVVERCEADTDLGKNLPSPSPSVLWDTASQTDAHQVCRNAAAVVEFSTSIDQKTVSKDSVYVQKCSGIDAKNTCLNPVRVNIAPDSFKLKAASQGVGLSTQFLNITNSLGRWEENAWYQIVLNKNIKSAGAARAVGLAPDKPCGDPNSAYCFAFKTGTNDCRVKTIVVTPYKFWTQVLEAPMKSRTAAGEEKELRYYGNGLTDQHCIMMDMSAFSWDWKAQNTAYADIYASNHLPSAQVSALSNTVGIGLTRPDDAVYIQATAALGNNNYTGVSPLTINLNVPTVVDYWPKCLEACTNAEVGVKFNTTLSNHNLPGAAVNGSVQLWKCQDENCQNKISVLDPSQVFLDPTSNYTVLRLANDQADSLELEPNSLYQVGLSSESTDPQNPQLLWSAAKYGNPNSISRPFNQFFTWRFRTKKDRCRIDRAAVAPSLYNASSLQEKAVYSVEAYSSPDSCSAQGQKVNAWSVNWDWNSSNLKVATLTAFSTQGKNPDCTSQCVRKGSDIPAEKSTPVALCGNGLVEAGEDCDAPNKNQGCALNCTFLGNTSASCGNGIVERNFGEACDPKDPKTSSGCSLDCRHTGSLKSVEAQDVNSSICGNGLIGNGEDCDVGINTGVVNVANPVSAVGCSQRCLHTGSVLAKNWCIDNKINHGGFALEAYNAACAKSYSQCGDKVQSPDEDPGCETVQGWNSDLCTNYCLKKRSPQCLAGGEGCGNDGRLLGSSLSYKLPSVCGDGKIGVGEDGFCETGFENKRIGLSDPWALVTGIGQGETAGDPPAQMSIIKAGVKDNGKAGVNGSGTYSITCGYKNNQECQDTFGTGYGLGKNGCCYATTKLISTYPVNNASAVCPNTYIEAVFDSKLDPGSVEGKIVLARGTSALSCENGLEDVTALVAASQAGNKNFSFTEKVFYRVRGFIKNLFSNDVVAVGENVTKWCAGKDVVNARLVDVGASTSTSKILVNLLNPLSLSTDYLLVFKGNVTNVLGVPVVGSGDKKLSWKFATASKICQIKSTEVNPNTWSFSVSGASTTLQAVAKDESERFVQPIPGFYDWNFVWGPANNPYVTLQNTSAALNIITAQNRNGEVDVRASANVVVDKFNGTNALVATGRSHGVVFLCENPWPPKQVEGQNKAMFTIFPYEDKINNNDGFDLLTNVFNNTPLPASQAVNDGYFNFSTYYCADKGGVGTNDDLPFLRPAVQVASNIVATSASLKRFLFTNEKNSDAIGVQIFPNPNHLTLEQWYASDKTAGGQGFVGKTQKITIGGYEAIRDNNNIYLDALNYSDVTKNLYTNVYLFSINSDAGDDTRQVFNQLVQNIKFNINVTNYRYCGKDAANPGFITACNTDLDCVAGEVCSAQIDKLKRNYNRLRDAGLINNLLQTFALQHNGTYPDLKEGTYLNGQTLSSWPSWGTLGNTLGSGLPLDPVNVLAPAGTCSKTVNRFCTQDSMCPSMETCVLHDPVTGWSVQDRRFSFACSAASYAYRYIAQPNNGFAVRAHFEDPGLPINNLAAFERGFVDPAHFIFHDSSGICNQDQEISTLNQGTCGDGSVNLNRGEQCDPPQAVRYGTCSVDQPNKIKVDVCSSGCLWVPSSTPFVDCSFLSRCGNGKVESGEQCDEGALNGRYNHCSSTCTLAGNLGKCGDGIVQKDYEVCDVASGLAGKQGWCLGGVQNGQGCNNDQECNSLNGKNYGLGGVCKVFGATRIRYAANQTASCNWDCQSYGLYCGDGTVQSEYGEECEGDQTCSVNGRSGNRTCDKTTCKWVDTAAVAWWKFDTGTLNKDTITFAGTPGGAASCSAEDCPQLVASHVQNAVQFKEGQFLSLANPSSLDLDTKAWYGEQSRFSLLAWIKAVAGNADQETRRLVLLKQRSKNSAESSKEKAYLVSYFVKGDKVVALEFNALRGSLGNTRADLVQPFNVNEWHQIGFSVGYSAGGIHEFKAYVDGKLVASDTQNGAENIGVSDFSAMPAETTDGNLAKIGGSVGAIDELKVYNRLLSDAEVASDNQLGLYCDTSKSQAAAVISSAPVCGDGRVDPGEACDQGNLNGVKCTPAYGKSCTYCSAVDNCKNIIAVQPEQYCGDGVVQAKEVCDTDPIDQTIIYAAEADATTTEKIFDQNHGGYKMLSCSNQLQNDFSLKKGSVKCVNNCTVIQSDCVTCGFDPKSKATVSGNMVNVIDPASTNPLLGRAGGFPKLDLYISTQIDSKKLVGIKYWNTASGNAYYLRPPTEDGFTSKNTATINSNSICSFGDAPTYNLRINNDAVHQFAFPVYPQPKDWQYDLLLSPVINQNVRPDDVRIVLSWINSTDFNGGFVTLANGSPALEGAGLKTVTGLNYFDTAPEQGIWYHGYKGVGAKNNVESFTVHTGNAQNVSVNMSQDEYLFYIRTADGSPIRNYKNSALLKVQVYLPEDDANRQHFANPSLVYNFNAAQASANPDASYWQVFFVKKALNGSGVSNRIVPINKITTDTQVR